MLRVALSIYYISLIFQEVLLVTLTQKKKKKWEETELLFNLFFTQTCKCLIIHFFYLCLAVGNPYQERTAPKLQRVLAFSTVPFYGSELQISPFMTAEGQDFIYKLNCNKELQAKMVSNTLVIFHR